MRNHRVRQFCLGAGALAACAAAGTASAQSNVQIYGVLDVGVTRVSNVSGKSLWLEDTGVMQASRMGFRGSEDLGGGLSAIFTLEQGIILDTGALGQGGLAFGRQSWVGLKDVKLGTLTLGRQYDFMFDSIVGFINSTHDGGGYANNPLDNDRMSGQRVNNAVKYVTPSFSGFSAGAMVAPSEANGTIRGAGYSRSFGANYKNGGLALGAAYTYLDGLTLDTKALTGGQVARVIGGSYNRIYGFGGSYQPDSQWTIHAVVNESKFVGTSAAANGRFRNYEGGVVYSPVPVWRLGVSGGTTKLDGRSYNQLNLSADYVFSKRTDGYVQLIGQRASGNGATANIFLLSNSSTNSQNALRVGLRHRF
jgi:predicted porin